MRDIVVTILPRFAGTQLLVTEGDDELLRAVLPAPDRIEYRSRAAPTLLEGLCQWLDSRLRVVLFADAPYNSFCLGLTDELGRGEVTVYYEVEVVSPRLERHPVLRLGGVDDFRLVHRLRRRALIERGAA